MMPQVDACIGTELLGLAHTDNGRRDCRRGWEADEPVLRRSRRRVKRPRQVSFRICTTYVRVTYYTTVPRSQCVLRWAGACLACLACPCSCVVRPFLCVALPRGKWRSAHRRLCSLSMCQHMKSPPSIRCIASPAGPGDAGNKRVDGPGGTQRLWGFGLVLSAAQAASHRPGA